MVVLLSVLYIYIFIADSSLHNKCLLWPALGADERGIFVKVLCVAACLLNRLLSISVWETRTFPMDTQKKEWCIVTLCPECVTYNYNNSTCVKRVSQPKVQRCFLCSVLKQLCHFLLWPLQFFQGKSMSCRGPLLLWAGEANPNQHGFMVFQLVVVVDMLCGVCSSILRGGGGGMYEYNYNTFRKVPIENPCCINHFGNV